MIAFSFTLVMRSCGRPFSPELGNAQSKLTQATGSCLTIDTRQRTNAATDLLTMLSAMYVPLRISCLIKLQTAFRESVEIFRDERSQIKLPT